MRRLVPIGAVGLLAVVISIALSQLSAGDKTSEPVAPTTVTTAPLVVHEWGTFTNYSGSDGVQLEFRPLAVRDLPGFVQTYHDKWGISLRKSELRAFQRMETPVTYFYTPVERDVQVRVRFPEGLLTEFFPPVVRMTPERPVEANPFSEIANTPANLSLKDSSLDWGTVHLIPIDSLTTQVDDPLLAKSMGRYLAEKLVPDASAFRHYVHARETDSALVDVSFDGKNGSGFQGDYFEKFLFYRGLGNFKLPLALEAHGQGAYQLANRGDDTIRSLFLVTIRGNELRFNTYEQIGGNSTLTMVEGLQTANIDELAGAMSGALEREGLYRKEAEAMVNSWRDSWFAEEGTRLLYMVPQRITDDLLPLEITPKPDEMVRVLVGRMEIMSPEDERHVLELVQRSATARAIEQQTAEPEAGSQQANVRRDRETIFEELLAMGRLAEPALVRANNVTTEESVRTEAGQLTAELREYVRQRGL